MNSRLHVFCGIFLVLSFFGCTRLHYGIKKDYDFSRINRIAVMGIEDYPGFKGSGEAITAQVILRLIERDYDVIERTKIETLLQEHKLVLSGVLNTDTVDKIGEIAGVSAIITGTIVEYSPKTFFKIPVEILKRGGERLDSYYDSEKKAVVPIKIRDADREYRTVEIRTIEASVGFNLRMLDVESGSIVWAGSYTYNSLDINHAIAQVADKILSSLPR